MSRRKSKNRNVRIGILEGKSAAYNQAILEVLYEQNRPLTSWEVAKGLQGKLKPTTNKEAMQTRVRNIYSVIQRNGGRLQELQRKHYIIPEHGKWRLSRWKGRIAVYITNPESTGKLEMETYKKAMTLMRTSLKTPSDQETKLPFGITLSIKGNELKQDVRTLLTRIESDPSFIRLVVEETKQLIMEGIDLDLITDESLIALLALRKSVKKKLKQLL